MSSVRTYLERNRQRLELERHGVGPRPACVLLTPRFRASRHVVALVLREGSAESALVVKLPRLEGDADGVEREAAALTALQELLPGGPVGIPRLVSFVRDEARPVLVQTALAGVPMSRADVRSDRDGCVHAVEGWLTTLDAHGRSIDHELFERLLERPLRRFAAASGEGKLVEETIALVDPLRDSGLESVFEHGDLSEPNLILLPGGGIGVVDWELAEPNGLPAHDLTFFLAYAAFASDRATTLEDQLAAYRAAFLGPAAWAANRISAYAGRLDIPVGLLTPLHVACWARQSAGLLSRLDGETDPVPRPEVLDWLRKNRFYAIWREAVRSVGELGWH